MAGLAGKRCNLEEDSRAFEVVAAAVADVAAAVVDCHNRTRAAVGHSHTA